LNKFSINDHIFLLDVICIEGDIDKEFLMISYLNK